MEFRDLAKAISKIENDPAYAQELLSNLYKENSETLVLGITGPPGAGKSSLTDGIVTKFREQNKKVAVIAVDPSSPFTGGAILGDRIRMSSHFTDPGVFIRSMGSRGSLGGLAPAAMDVTNLLKSDGFDVVIIETVGVGQSEIDVMHLVDTVLLVLVPGAGDDIQAMKAGIMEIADIFVVNKADKPGKERLLAEINMLLMLNHDKFDWIPPVVETVATEYKGIDTLINEMARRTEWVMEHYDAVKKPKITNRFKWMIEEKLRSNILAILKNNGILDSWINGVSAGIMNPYSAIRELDKRLRITMEE